MPALSPGKPVDRSARHRGPFAVLQARAHDAVERLFASKVPWILLFFLALIPLAVGPRLAPEPPALPAGPGAPARAVAPAAPGVIREGGAPPGRRDRPPSGPPPPRLRHRGPR